MEYEHDGDTNCNRCVPYSQQMIGKGTGRIGNKNTCGNQPNDSIVKIGQNTEKSPGDLKSTCCRPYTNEGSSANTSVKNSQMSKIIEEPEPVLKNETLKILWDFKIQIDNVIPARRPDQVILNLKKENL